MDSVQSRGTLAQHPTATLLESSPRTWTLIISARDLQKVRRFPTDNIFDMLQHLLITRRDRVPVDEIRRVEFDPEDEILGNVPADFGGYSTK